MTSVYLSHKFNSTSKGAEPLGPGLGAKGMKRYFEIIGMRQTIELDIINGSQATTATAEEIGKQFKLNLREINKKEYTKLSKEYTKR